MERSKQDAWDVDKREEVLTVFDFVFCSVQSFGFFVSEDLNKAGLDNFLSARSRLQPVIYSSITSEPHATLNNHSYNLGMSI